MLHLGDELEFQLDGTVGEDEVQEIIWGAADVEDEESVEEVLGVEVTTVETTVVEAVAVEAGAAEAIAAEAVAVETVAVDTTTQDLATRAAEAAPIAVDVQAQEDEDVEIEEEDAQDEADAGDAHDDFTALADRYAGESESEDSRDEDYTGSDSPPADIEIDDAALFFVDTAAETNPSSSAPLYDAPSHTLGTRPALAKQNSTAEDIIFRPKIISDPVASASTSRAPATAFELRDVYVDPRVRLNRKDRKAAKREKRARNKRKQKGGRRSGGGELAPRDDSDIDWGSDGPPPGRILGIVQDDEVNHLGRTLAGTDLDEDVDPELNDEDLTRFIAGMVQIEGDRDVMDMMEHDEEEDSEEWSGSEGKGKGKVSQHVDNRAYIRPCLPTQTSTTRARRRMTRRMRTRTTTLLSCKRRTTRAPTTTAATTTRRSSATGARMPGKRRTRRRGSPTAWTLRLTAVPCPPAVRIGTRSSRRSSVARLTASCLLVRHWFVPR